VRRLDSFAKRVALIAAAGLTLRVLYALFIADYKLGAPFGDFFFYNWSADLIARGKGYLNPMTLAFVGHHEQTATHPPLWSFVLSIPSLLGGHSSRIGDVTTTAGYLPHRLFGCLIGATTILLVAYIARRVAGPRVGLLAAGLAAVYLPLIAVDASTMSETLYGPLIALVLLTAYRVFDRPTIARALALGLAIGLAALTRSEAIFLVPILVLPLAWRVRPHFVRVAVVASLGTALLVVPWTIRNYVVFHQVVVISTNEGSVWAGANCNPSYYGPGMGGWNVACLRKRSYRENEAQDSDANRRKGLDYMEGHASRLPLLVLVRILRSWNFYKPGEQASVAEAHPLRVEFANEVVYFLMLPLGAYGLLLLAKRKAFIWPLLAPFLLVTLVSAVLYGYPRFWHAAHIPLVVLAAAALVHLYDRRAVLRRVLTRPVAVDRVETGGA
jgi:hypothetical protein